MKTADVQIGQVYLCRIGETLRQVTVTARHPGDMRASGRRGPDVFSVRRVGSNTDLPKHRHATALRPCPETPPNQQAVQSIVKDCFETGNAAVVGTPPITEPVFIEDDYERIDSNTLRKNLIGAVQVSSLEELEETLNIPPPSPACLQAGEKAFRSTLNAGGTHEEAIAAAETAFDKQSDAELIKAGLLQPPTVPPKNLCIVCGKLYTEDTEGNCCGAECRAIIDEKKKHIHTALGQLTTINARSAYPVCLTHEPYEDKLKKLLDPPDNAPTPIQPGIIVSQEYYLSAAETNVGWCTNCKAFRGDEVISNAREDRCPECHMPTLWGAELALAAGLIEVQEDK